MKYDACGTPACPALLPPTEEGRDFPRVLVGGVRCMGQKSHIPLIPGEPGMVSAGNFLGTRRPRPLGLFSFMEKTSSGSLPRGFGFCRAIGDLFKGVLLPYSGLNAACLGVSWESIEIGSIKYVDRGQAPGFRS